MELFNHQEVTANFLTNNKSAYVLNGCGTGKTISVIEAFNRLRTGRMLVLAPLSILENAWVADIKKYNRAFNSEITVAVAYGDKKKRQRAFESGADIVVMNYEGCHWLVDNLGLLEGFSIIAMDESTYVKNTTARRSKEAKMVSRYFDYRWLMTGTPNPNSVLDLWNQAFILDNGERLGKRFYAFRANVCIPIQVAANANAIQWQDKVGALDFVHDKLSDITIRFTLEECIDMPEQVVQYMTVKMPTWIRKMYDDLIYNSFLEIDQSEITAIHAGARAKKILQLLSGAVYNDHGEAVRVHSERYNLVMDLVEQRDHTVVAFNYRHERNALIEEANKRKMNFAVIDGSVKSADRTRAVEEFQAGKHRVIFIHPQAAGHGITLTRGNTLVWCSPVYSAELSKQTEHRIYRAGQKRRTQIIRIAYEDSKEISVYEVMGEKSVRMLDLLGLFKKTTN